jgi:amino-acid N-acetyltransferase
VTIERATLADVEQMKSVLDVYASKGELLSRSRLDLYGHIRDFIVAKEDGEVIGLAAVHILWFDLVEIRSLAVREDRQGRGVGKLLVEKCLEDSKDLGIKKVFALTYRAGFFKNLGFKEVDKSELPHKVWLDCIHCTQFPNCNEIPVMIEV